VVEDVSLAAKKRLARPKNLTLPLRRVRSKWRRLTSNFRLDFSIIRMRGSLSFGSLISHTLLKSHSTLVRPFSTTIMASETNGNPSDSKVGTITHRIQAEYTRGPDVWSTFNPIVFPEACNLGQGFMNWSPPSFIKDALTSFAADRVDVHHYSHPKGRPRLRKALADQHSSSYRKPKQGENDVVKAGATPDQRPDEGVQLDPETNIQITAGANGAIYCAMTAFLEPGDEVIFISPHFDQYECEVSHFCRL
jgi:DNA-binding transcriptional MocR family regulator